MKPFYLFDAASGEFQGTYEAQESPLEPGVHIAPVHSTDIAPLELSAKQAAVFADGAWSAVADHRGETWYDQTTGNAVEIEELGEPASHLAPELPAAMQLAQARDAQAAVLNSACRQASAQPVSYLGTTFQADAASQDKVHKALVALNGQVPDGFYWLDAANEQVAMTFADLQGLAAAMWAQDWAAFQNLQTKKAAVLAATTVADVQAVAW